MQISRYLNKAWRDVLGDYIGTEPFQNLLQKVDAEYKNHYKTIYPPQDKIFNALNSTALNSVKIVILGQDPYHGEGQAHGLAFSVPSGIPTPPSLKNIFKEIVGVGPLQFNTDMTDLTRWAEQGVLLLNSVLTVEAGKPGSHANIGWEDFTDHVIKTVSDTQENIIFMLWGNYARNKKKLIDNEKHLILEAPHPSPLSAYRGFFGCEHFSKANKYLKKHGITQLLW